MTSATETAVDVLALKFTLSCLHIYSHTFVFFTSTTSNLYSTFFFSRSRDDSERRPLHISLLALLETESLYSKPCRILPSTSAGATHSQSKQTSSIAIQHMDNLRRMAERHLERLRRRTKDDELILEAKHLTKLIMEENNRLSATVPPKPPPSRAVTRLDRNEIARIFHLTRDTPMAYEFEASPREPMFLPPHLGKYLTFDGRLRY